jgi:hypothetical protein
VPFASCDSTDCSVNELTIDSGHGRLSDRLVGRGIIGSAAFLVDFGDGVLDSLGVCVAFKFKGLSTESGFPWDAGGTIPMLAAVKGTFFSEERVKARRNLTVDADCEKSESEQSVERRHLCKTVRGDEMIFSSTWSRLLSSSGQAERFGCCILRFPRRRHT